MITPQNELLHEIAIAYMKENLCKLFPETCDGEVLYEKVGSWDDYSKIFELCKMLEISYLYDIGCGDAPQALLLRWSPDVQYIGINKASRLYSPDKLNKFFAEICDNVTYMQVEYPVRIPAPCNNIAISWHTLGTNIQMQKGYDSIISTIKALSRDFERLIISIQNECIFAWKTEMADTEFTFHITEHIEQGGNILFATKYPKEIYVYRKWLEENTR